jgi:hypothetical protein
MRGTGFWVLVAAAAAVAVAAGWGIERRYAETAVEQVEGEAVFPGLADRVADIAAIDIARDGKAFTLRRHAGAWANEGIGGYPARGVLIERAIGGLAGLRYAEPKTVRADLYPKLEVEEVGAGAKSTRMTVKSGDGAVIADLIVGKPKPGAAGLDRDGVYIRMPGAERAWLAEGTLDVRHAAADWSERTVLNVPPRDLVALTVVHPDGETVDLHRAQPTDADLTVRTLPPGGEIENQYQIDYMSALLENVQFENARAASVTPIVPGQGYRVRAVTKAGLSVEMATTDPDADHRVWVTIEVGVDESRSPDDAARDAARRLSETVSGWSYQLVRAKTERLRIRLKDIVKINPNGNRGGG